MLCCPPISSPVLSQPPRYPLGWFEHEPTRRDHDSAGRARKMQTRPQWSWPHGTSTYGLGSEGSEQKQRRQIHVANSIPICYHMLIYAPCSVFLPTFGWFAGQMLVNMPYMEHMGYPQWRLFIIRAFSDRNGNVRVLASVTCCHQQIQVTLRKAGWDGKGPPQAALRLWILKGSNKMYHLFVARLKRQTKTTSIRAEKWLLPK